MRTRLLIMGFCCSAAVSLILAYPPAPHHLVYGTVRDELGNPLTSLATEIILETAAGMKISTFIASEKERGANYHIGVPMDSGITSVLYKPTALRPAVPFKIRVRIGQSTYLPIEMSADYSKLGESGEKTRIDLTLGEDSDGDGMPDAWERMLAARNGKSLAEISGSDDFDGDGLNNLEEYLAGTYAFDPANGFALTIVRSETRGPILEFMAVRGRTYTVLGSSDLKQWIPVSFAISTNGSTANALENYYARDTRLIQVQALLDPGQSPVSFFKLIVQ